MIYLGKSILVSALIGLAFPVTAGDSSGDLLRNWTMSEEVEDRRWALYKAYSACSQEASQRAISIHEAEACAELYMRLKLTFLRGSDYERYLGLSPATRAMANDKSYAAYIAWLHRNAHLINVAAELTDLP